MIYIYIYIYVCIYVYMYIYYPCFKLFWYTYFNLSEVPLIQHERACCIRHLRLDMSCSSRCSLTLCFGLDSVKAAGTWSSLDCRDLSGGTAWSVASIAAAAVAITNLLSIVQRQQSLSGPWVGNGGWNTVKIVVKVIGSRDYDWLPLTNN